MMSVLLLLALCVSPTFAGPQDCAADAAALCPKAPHGPERLRCLEEHQAQLSHACKEHIARERAEGEAFRSDCKAEIGAACLNLQGRALVECLEAQGDKLSKPCADRLSSIKGARQAARERIAAECVDDAQKHCAGVPSGAVAACLSANKAKLSAACAAALK